MTSAEQIRDARARTGLTQRRLALLAGVPQPNLSSYESGKVEPRPETLARILAATTTRASDALRAEREGVIVAATRRRASNVRVFGSVARGTEDDASDIDLLVTFAPDASILDAAGLVLDLEKLLGRPVDVMSDRAEGPILDRALAEAVPL
jgi:predicted nucleotidyltransferase